MATMHLARPACVDQDEPPDGKAVRRSRSPMTSTKRMPSLRHDVLPNAFLGSPALARRLREPNPEATFRAHRASGRGAASHRRRRRSRGDCAARDQRDALCGDGHQSDWGTAISSGSIPRRAAAAQRAASGSELAREDVASAAAHDIVLLPTDEAVRIPAASYFNRRGVLACLRRTAGRKLPRLCSSADGLTDRDSTVFGIRSWAIARGLVSRILAGATTSAGSARAAAARRRPPSRTTARRALAISGSSARTSTSAASIVGREGARGWH